MSGRVVILWSPPRCRSTAFARVMMERGDLTVVHEPFSNRAAVGRAAVGTGTARTDPELLGLLLELGAAGPVFVKDTTDYRYPELLADPRLAEAENTFIIRDPAEAIASHHAMNPDVTLPEIGFERCWELFEVLRERTGRAPVVVDSADLVARPAALIESYCAAVGLPFLAHALTWRPGQREEWSRTAAWHRDAAATTGIEARSGSYPATVHTDERLAAYDRHHRPFYDRLRAHKLEGEPGGQP